MELQQLKYFKTVAENGKISDAANTLYISPPALSTAIQRLEKDVGCQLFDRTKNRISLNQQGLLFLKHVNRIFDELDLAKKEISESLSVQSSTISLVGINALIWSGLIVDFSAANPDISVSFTMIPISALPKQNLTHQHTFLLATDSDIPDSIQETLDSVLLFENSPMVMISPDHPLANEKSITVSQLKNENIIMTTPDHTMYREIEKLLAAHNIPIPANAMGSNEMRQQLVEKNLGISFVSKYGSSFMSPTLRYIPLEDATTWMTKLYWEKGRKLNQNEEQFLKFAQEYFNNQSAESE